MLLFKKVVDLQNHLNRLRKAGASIGFVPTMGALHHGHLSLIDKSKKSTETTVASIFVNPTQFNEAADLKNYPRTISEDIEKLASAKCDILFLPAVDEVYPEAPAPLHLDFGYLDQPMEGAHRPGHFAGVAQVVKRLLDIVQPEKLFMGQKDYQQAAIVRNMIGQLEIPTELVVCPIVREEDGLAMSSRNRRLSGEQRALAPHIFQTLEYAKSMVNSMPPASIEEAAFHRLKEKGMRPEYFEIVDGTTLKKLENFGKSKLVVACTAVNLGDIRLIDNMMLVNKS